MNSELIETLLKEVRDIRVGVIGDFCQDCYWDLCPEDDVVSVETGIAVQRFTKQRYSLGGAGNVAMNLSDLGVQNIYAFGVVGKDPFSKQMLALMNENGINSDGMLYQEENWNTPCYIKPITNGVEGHRMDFGCFNTISPEMESVLLSTIRGAMDHLDIVIVNQQLPPGLHSDTFIEGLNAIVIEANKFFILDSRDLGDKYHGMIKKINDYEVMLAAGHDVTPFDDIDIDDLLDACKKAFEKWQHAFVVTRGHKGCLIVKPGNISEIPGIKVNGEIDSVGAGDTFIAGLAAAFGGQSKLPEATEFANLMASITVTKLNETGTASPAEIREAASELNYLYHQDLAENVDKAVYWTDSSIEVINGPGTDEIKHIIFDHDGTLSVLREGWERVMQPVMMKA
ncbi:MAG: hypothetical protein HRT89_07630, partial [Lentisphaeria bacterium]|nr:hypothetical protein [Lentisphaeria bacterium]